MMWRCLTQTAAGCVVGTAYYDTEAAANEHATARRNEGYVCTVRQGTLAADGTFTPAVGG